MTVQRLTPAKFSDARGELHVTYLNSDDALWPQEIIVHSKANVIRGFHCQVGQTKIVRCLSGHIFDAVITPSGEIIINHLRPMEGIVVPPGIPHAYCTLEDSLVHYKFSVPYDAKTEKTIPWTMVKVPWPIDVNTAISSAKDRGP